MEQSITEQIEQQGELLRKLKNEKADKNVIKEAIDKLLELKSILKYLSSEEAKQNCPPDMTPEQRLNTILSVGAECISQMDLIKVLMTKQSPICYDGFEPSGRMHIAQGILKSINVNKLTSSGCNFVFWIADWFAQLNNKMGGDLNSIRIMGEYFIEVWKVCGMDMSKVQFLWASDEINKRPNEYWLLVMDIARKNNLKRVIRCSQIMGREESMELSAAQIFYPCMQCADIFFLKADICQLGLDQRKVNMLAREYCDDANITDKPVILSHRMMPGIKEGQAKMSKSDPDTAIFMEDTEEDVKRKINKAFCPPKILQDNPCIEYLEHMILPKLNNITIKLETGEEKTFTDIQNIKEEYVSGNIFPGELKRSLITGLNQILDPVRKHFENDPGAKELLKKVKELRG